VSDLHAEFERIIAGWDDEAPDPQPRGGASDPATGGSTDADVDAQVGSDAVTGIDIETETETGTETETDPETTRVDVSGTAAIEATPASAPCPADEATGGSSGLLELPIAPTTPHTWRGSTPQRDDADEILDAVEPYGDHFVPPSEIDLPSAETDPMYWAIVGGLAGGPLLLLYVLFFDRDGSGWWVVTALTMIVVGFVLLVLRGGTERDPFDDGTRV
jgi:hypothetical protein